MPRIAFVPAQRVLRSSGLHSTRRIFAGRSMKLSEAGELGLLAELERRGLAQRIENDAAALGDTGVIVTQDALVEGVHFRVDWISWRDLGWRAAAVNLSDLAASGADPDGLLVTLGAPAETEVRNILELYGGIAETNVPVLGGDTTQADRLFLSVTAIGRSSRVPGRAAARPGDQLVVTGPLGGAGAAFRREEFVRPPLRLVEGKELAAHAHAMLDISDGLAVDAGHLARRSGCRIVDDLGFGDDYELLAAVEDPGWFRVIGRCEEGEGLTLTLSGKPYELGGWQHFR